MLFMAKRLTQKEKHGRKCEYKERQSSTYDQMIRTDPGQKPKENFRRKLQHKHLL